MNTLGNKIKNALLFEGMEEAEIAGALEALAAKEKSYAKGEIILRAGEPTKLMGLVTAGSATIENNDMWGNRTILSRVGPGQFFAETYAMLKDEPLLVDVVASEPCSILFLCMEPLRRQSLSAMSWSAKLTANLLAISLQKNLVLANRSFHTAPKTIRARVMAYLNAVSLKKQSRTFDIPFDRQQLADYLNVERSALSKELGKMQREGLIFVRKNHFALRGDAADY